jgi:hypothetical protein
MAQRIVHLGMAGAGTVDRQCFWLVLLRRRGFFEQALLFF